MKAAPENDDIAG